MNDDLFQLGERIVELAARINIATYEMLTLIAEFDRREGWADESFTSCAEWLAVTTGRTLGTARENVRVAHALDDLPLTSKEMKTGKISYTKVRTMTRVATRETEETLLEYARAGSAAKLEQIVRGWKHLSRDGELTAEEARHQSRAFSVVIDGDGMYVMRGRLEPEVGAVLMRAIEAASDALYRAESPDARPRSRQRRADAAGLVAEQAKAARGRNPRCIRPALHPGWTLRSASLLAQMALPFSLVAPCQPGASPVSVLTRGFAAGCWRRGSVENPGRVPSGSRWRSTPRWPRWRRTGNRAVPRSTG